MATPVASPPRRPRLAPTSLLLLLLGVLAVCRGQGCEETSTCEDDVALLQSVKVRSSEEQRADAAHEAGRLHSNSSEASSSSSNSSGNSNSSSNRSSSNRSSSISSSSKGASSQQEDSSISSTLSRFSWSSLSQHGARRLEQLKLLAAGRSYQQLAAREALEASASRAGRDGSLWSEIDLDIAVGALIVLTPVLLYTLYQETWGSSFENPSNFGLVPRPSYRNLSGSSPTYSAGNAQTIVDGSAALRAAQNESRANALKGFQKPQVGIDWTIAQDELIGTYSIQQDTVPVTQEVEPSSRVLRSLGAGEVVVVEEVKMLSEAGLLRGRLKTSGWISIASTQDSREWAKKRGPGPIVMHGLLEGDKIGLSLNQDLVVTKLMDDRAALCGWCLGDQILQVNGIPVSGENDFLDEVKRATVVWKSTKQPIVFEVVRAAAGSKLPPPATSPLSGSLGASLFKGSHRNRHPKNNLACC